MLERPGSVESKVLMLRMVATLGESDQNKIEIGMLAQRHFDHNKWVPRYACSCPDDSLFN